MKKTSAALAAALPAAAMALGMLTSPIAVAVPGQCISTPWGGFCDGYPQSDGSFQHCHGAMGFSHCYQACLDHAGNPVPTDLDLSTRC